MPTRRRRIIVNNKISNVPLSNDGKVGRVAGPW